MENRQVEIGRLEKQLTQWGAKLDDLSEKVSTAGDKAKAEQRRLVADLKEKQKLAQAKLVELKDAGVDKWDSLKAGVESVYSDLESAFKNLGN